MATVLMGTVVMGSIAFFAGIGTAFSDEKDKEKDKDKLPQVLLKTNKGDILLELYEDQAPNTVANFVSLVEKGFYDKLKFHRVEPGFVVQGGDPKGNGSGGPGYRIKCECVRKDHKLHERGVLSMAHAGKDTGGSQFFITLAKTPNLDGLHTVFGHVIKGMDVVDKLKIGDVIEKATVEQKRDHEYKPEVIKK
jgi:peptidyl-prolyl cis-trans isomerase B (cyclophilin B)